MDPQVFATIIAGIFLLASVVVSVITAFMTKKTSDSVKHQSVALSKKFDETSKVSFIEGERACFDALSRLTLQEKISIKVTRFNHRKIQRQRRYYDAMVARILGSTFEDEPYGRIEKYFRLTALNSEENRQSILDMCNFFKSKDCPNLVLRVTLDKNDFELVILEELKTAVFCFHDFSKHEVLHSCIISRDEVLFTYFQQLYEKLWKEDIILEIDFSLGEEHVNEKIKVLSSFPLFPDKEVLSPIDGLRMESQFKIDLLNLVMINKNKA